MRQEYDVPDTQAMVEEKKKNRKKKNNILWIILVCLVADALLLIGGTFALNKSEMETSDGARIAIMASNADIQLTSITGYPGTSQVVPITVANFDNEGVTERICEVKQEYEIKVEYTPNDMPIEVAFYDNAECKGEAITPKGTFEARLKKHETYYLKITWPTTDEKGNAFDSEYSFEVAYLSIIVEATQVS